MIHAEFMMARNQKSSGNIDRALLRCFDALMTERSASLAAERLGISQPTMSNALTRLRSIFGDPLFLRARGQMMPTARALQLIHQVRTVLDDIDGLLSQQRSFDPELSSTTFRVSAPEYVEYMLIPELSRRLEKIAPHINVEFLPPAPDRVMDWLERGEVDFRMGWVRDPPPSARSKTLFRDRFACLVRKDHPVVKNTLKLEDYLSLPQIRTRTSARSEYWRVINEAFAAHRCDPRIAIVVQDFMVMPHVVARTNLIATIPEGLARSMAKEFSLQILKPPLNLPEIRIAAYWHERSQKDPAHRWFRGVLADVAQRL